MVLLTALLAPPTLMMLLWLVQRGNQDLAHHCTPVQEGTWAQQLHKRRMQTRRRVVAEERERPSKYPAHLDEEYFWFGSKAEVARKRYVRHCVQVDEFAISAPQP